MTAPMCAPYPRPDCDAADLRAWLADDERAMLDEDGPSVDPLDLVARLAGARMAVADARR